MNSVGVHHVTEVERYCALCAPRLSLRYGILVWPFLVKFKFLEYHKSVVYCFSVTQVLPDQSSGPSPFQQVAHRSFVTPQGHNVNVHVHTAVLGPGATMPNIPVGQLGAWPGGGMSMMLAMPVDMALGGGLNLGG